MKAVATIIGAGLACGVVGWAAENAFRDRPVNSKLFGDHQIPFLPVYAIGGALAVAMAPLLMSKPLWQQFVAYAVVTTTVEGVAGAFDRLDGKPLSWNYDTGLPVDLKYSVLWAAAAMAVGSVAIAIAESK